MQVELCRPSLSVTEQHPCSIRVPFRPRLCPIQVPNVFQNSPAKVAAPATKRNKTEHNGTLFSAMARHPWSTAGVANVAPAQME